MTCNWGPPGTAEPEVVQEGIPVDWRIVEPGVGLIRGEVRLREEGAGNHKTDAPSQVQP